MSKQTFIEICVTRRKYALFVYRMFTLILKDNRIRIGISILTIFAVLTILISPCSSCAMKHSLTVIYLPIFLPISFIIHELMHYVILDVDITIVLRSNSIRIKPCREVSSIRMICSALAGPLSPFLIGLIIIYYAEPLSHLNLFGIYLPFLLNIFILPYDILGALGIEFE